MLVVAWAVKKSYNFCMAVYVRTTFQRAWKKPPQDSSNSSGSPKEPTINLQIDFPEQDP